MKEDKRYVNLRFVACLFIGIILGIVASRFFLSGQMNVAVFVLTFVLVILIIFVAIIYAIKIKKSCIGAKFRVGQPSMIKWSAIGFGIAYVVGILIAIIPMLNIINITDYEGSVVVSGIVSDYVDNEDTYTQFLLDDCLVVTEDNQDKIDYKIIVNTLAGYHVELGDRVTFECELSVMNINDDYGMSKLSQSVGYSTYASIDDIVVTDGESELKDVIHNKVKNILISSLNSDNSEICFAILFGQKYGLPDNISQMFSYVGISHILAVSGLHIGVLVGLLWFLLRKIKINDHIKLIIFASILLFYSYLCGFSPSVCRASIMAFILAMCKTFTWEYDITNSLSLSGVIILLFNPLSLFSISFQLSFMCIFAIITLSPTLKKMFSKIKMPKVLSETLSISIAVNVVILPICINAFYEVSLLGILVNILVLPIFSIVYILLFAIIVLSLVLKPIGVLLVVSELFLHLIKTIAYYASLIPFGVWRVLNVSYWLMVIVSLITLTIHFLMVKHWWKYLVVSILCATSIVLIVVGSMPKNYDNGSMQISTQYKSNVILYVENDENILIGSDIEYNDLLKLAKQLRVKEIDKIVAYDLQLNSITELLSIIEEFNVKDVILPIGLDYSAILSKLPNVETFDGICNFEFLTINIIEDSDDIIGLKLDKLGVSYLVAKIDNTKTENRYLQENYSNIDYVITDDSELWIDTSSCIIDVTDIEGVQTF